MSKTDITTRRAEALDNFLSVWADSHLAGDLATKLTCIEADALIELLDSFGKSAAAAWWLSEHAEGDDEGDMHYQEEDN